MELERYSTINLYCTTFNAPVPVHRVFQSNFFLVTQPLVQHLQRRKTRFWLLLLILHPVASTVLREALKYFHVISMDRQMVKLEFHHEYYVVQRMLEYQMVSCGTAMTSPWRQSLYSAIAITTDSPRNVDDCLRLM